MRWFFDVNAVNIEKPAEKCHYPKKAPKPPKKTSKNVRFVAYQRNAHETHVWQGLGWHKGA